MGFSASAGFSDGQKPSVHASCLQQPLKPLEQLWKKPVPGAQTVGSDDRAAMAGAAAPRLAMERMEMMAEICILMNVVV